MKRLKFAVLFFSCAILAISSCKKIEENPQEFVQNKLVEKKWPLKFTIRRVITDNFIIKIDTPTIHSPVDTLVFSPDGTVIKRNGDNIIFSTNYTIDAAGQNITFALTPPITQKLNYVRDRTIGLLVSDATEKIGGTEVRTIIEDQLVSN